jgi:O-antigen/teichoic acid export membrane protein
MAAFGISCLIALGILFKHLGNVEISFSWNYTKKLLRWSAPYALVLLTMSAYTRMDSIMLEHILDDGGRESGIYEYGYRFLDALNMVGYLFAALLLPMYASNIKDNKIIKDLVDVGLRLMVLITFIGAAAMITYRHEIMQWAHADATSYYSDIMLYLMLSFIPLSIAYIFGSLLLANNSLKKINILLLIGVFINFGLNYYLIPQQQALGAAKATLATQLLMTLGQIFLVVNILKLKLHPKLLFNVTGFGLFCILIFGSIYVYLPMNWLIRAAISICFSLLAALTIKLVDIRMIIDLVLKKSST